MAWHPPASAGATPCACDGAGDCATATVTATVNTEAISVVLSIADLLCLIPFMVALSTAAFRVALLPANRFANNAGHTALPSRVVVNRLRRYSISTMALMMPSR